MSRQPLRFMGFDEPFNYSKIKDIIKYGSSGGTPNTAIRKYWDGTIPFLTISDITSTSGFIYDTEKHISFEGLANSSAWIVPKESISLAMYASVGKVAILKTNLATSQAFYNMVLENDSTKDYLYQYLVNMDIEKAWNKEVLTGTQPNLTARIISDYEISIPSLPEQQTIGNYLKNIDTIIDNQTHKITKLENIKKSLLANLFPKKDSTKPFLRFRGFHDQFNCLKIKDIIKYGSSGGTPNTAVKKYWDGTIPFLTISDITSANGFINDTEKHISYEGLTNSSSWIVPRESISLAMYASVGKVAILKTDVATSQAFYNMVIDDASTKNYLYQYLLKMDIENAWEKEFLTGTQPNLTARIINDYEISIPSLKEQQTIGKYLNTLDQIINLNKQKLTKLKNIKQSLLQKLLV